MAFDKTKFIARFIEEAQEHIEVLNEGLVKLENEPGDTETVNQIFRSAHTIKGSSKILNLKEINQVAHKLEDALDALRDNKIQQSSELFDLIFKAVDIIADMVGKTLESETLDVDTTEICQKLSEAAQGGAAAAVQEAAPVSAEPPPLAPEPPPVAATPPETKPPPVAAPAPVLAEPPPVAKETQTPAPAKTAPIAKKTKSRTAETVRISTAKLDETVKLMGEIVSNHIRMKQNLVDIDEIGKLSKKFLDQFQSVSNDPAGFTNGKRAGVLETAHAVQSKLRDLSANTKDVLNFQTLLTDDLREKVLKMRMLPLSTATDAFSRLVRDLASSCNKKIHFTVEGAETELDKKIIEKIGDPLLHMIRNSLDHGIESPEERVKAGKPETGELQLIAGYEGGSVLIQLKDDGAGVAVDKVKEKALRKGLFDEETLNRMSKSEIVNLIFRAGFSTAPIITDLSGRGVGMDVVKDNIVMQLKGSVQIETEEGKGTSFFIRLPLTLAVMRVLLVEVSDFVCALPLNSVREIIKIDSSEIIEVVNKRAISLRDQIIPVVHLDRTIDLPDYRQSDPKELVVVLVAMGSEHLGLIVDSIVSEEDMEIKSMPSHMKNNELVSGVTLSGKNNIVLVLHVPQLFSLAKAGQEARHLEDAEEEEEVKRLRILVVDDSISTREIEKSILESYGYEVETARDGADGLEKARKTQYDLVVTDIEMPRMNGFELTQRLRGEESYKLTPIIIVSSLDKDADKHRGMEVGADAYIIKGAFDQTNLLDTIQTLTH